MSTQGLTSDIKKRSTWGIVMGVLTAILGVFLIAYPLATAAITTIVIGTILIIAAVAHVVFALHFYAFLMILLCGLLITEAASAWLGAAGMRDLDKPLFALLLVASAVYLYVATGVANGARGWAHAAKAVALTLVVGAMISVYRFAIFLITLYSMA